MHSGNSGPCAGAVKMEMAAPWPSVDLCTGCTSRYFPYLSIGRKPFSVDLLCTRLRCITCPQVHRSRQPCASFSTPSQGLCVSRSGGAVFEFNRGEIRNELG